MESEIYSDLHPFLNDLKTALVNYGLDVARPDRVNHAPYFEKGFINSRTALFSLPSSR